MKMLVFFAIFTIMVTRLNAMMPNGVKVGSQDRFGQVQNPKTFPFIVHLETTKLNTTINIEIKQLCGGSLIRWNTILTAAHCVAGALPQNVEATAGIVHTGIVQQSQQTIVGRRVVCHEEYSFFTNDIALVFLEKKFQKSSFVDTIRLAEPSQYHDHMSVTAVGWGLLTNERQTEWLHRGDFKVADIRICKQLARYNFHEGLLCVYDPNGLQSTGGGDSGGPLVRNDVLVGVTTGTSDAYFGLNNVRTLSLFANVGYYTDWILGKIGYEVLFFEERPIPINSLNH